MELEADILNKAALSLDPNTTKVAHSGYCETCNAVTTSASNPFCTKCALTAIRNIATGLRRYL